MVKRKKKAAAASSGGSKKGAKATTMMEDAADRNDTADDTAAEIVPHQVGYHGPGFTRYAPAPEEVAAMQRYFVDRRDELQREVSEIEAMLGFVVQSNDLAVRVAKIEQFLGIKA